MDTISKVTVNDHCSGSYGEIVRIEGDIYIVDYMGVEVGYLRDDIHIINVDPEWEHKKYQNIEGCHDLPPKPSVIPLDVPLSDADREIMDEFNKLHQATFDLLVKAFGLPAEQCQPKAHMDSHAKLLENHLLSKSLDYRQNRVR